MKIILPSFILYYLLTPGIFAQTAPETPKKQCDALLTRQIVEQLATESKSVAETDRRVRILIKIADFLWVSDRETARGYFNDAFSIASERFNEKGYETKTSQGLIMSEPDFRFEVIRAVAKRDGELAKKMMEIVLKDFEENKDKTKRQSFDSEREISEMIALAAEISDQNPALALFLLRRAYGYPLTFAWYFNLFKVADKNPALADQIYAELLNNYRNTDVFRLLYLSAYPFARERIFGIDKFSLGTTISENFQPRPVLQRQFLEFFLRRVLQLTAESSAKSISSQASEPVSAISALTEIEPLVFQQFPELTQLFNRAKVHAVSLMTASDLEFQNRRDNFNRTTARTFAARLEQLEKDDEEGKLTDTNIIQLLTAAKTEEDFEDGESWLEKIKEEKARTDTTNYFYFLRAKNDLKDKRFDDARKNAEKIIEVKHRAIIYFDLADAVFKETNNKTEAMDALLEAEKAAKKLEDSLPKAQIYFGLAQIYVKFDNFNALDTLSNAVKIVNKLENVNIFSNFEGQTIRTNTFSFFASFSTPGFDMNNVFYDFSKVDFQNALTYAESFSNKYYRTLAVLAAVKDCEKNQPPKKKSAPK